MGSNLFLSNDIDYVARDRIEKVSFQVPGVQDIHLQLLGDNIHQISNYSIQEGYFDGADGSRYVIERSSRVDVYCWSNLLGRFMVWASQRNKKFVCQVFGHTSVLMFNQASTIRTIPVGQGNGGMSLMHLSIQSKCPTQQVYRGHDILAPLPWLEANVVNIGSEWRLVYEHQGIPYYFWFDAAPTFNTTTYQWECGATTNVFVRVPWSLEGSTVSPKGNGTGVSSGEWVLEALNESLAVLGSSTTTLLTPTGTRYLQLRSNNNVNAKSLEQPAIQVLTHGSDSVNPTVLVPPRSLNIVIAPN